MEKDELINKISNHESCYGKTKQILGDLQPLAFLISATLVIANFIDGSSLKSYALFSCLCFFLAYIGLSTYIVFNFNFLYYWGTTLLVFGFILLYYSFGNIVSEIDTFNVPTQFKFLFYSVIFSVLVIGNLFFLKISKKNRRYRISKILMILGVFYILVYISLVVFEWGKLCTFFGYIDYFKYNLNAASLFICATNLDIDFKKTKIE
jgi:hypothetical protein